MKTVMVVFGTRPEIIKLVPVIKELQKYPDEFRTVLVATGQHREFTDQMLAFFGINPDYNFDIMQERQSLSDIVARVTLKLDPILEVEGPAILLVQGDTTTVFAATVAAANRRIHVGHVEAGLRTSSKWTPFPEEINRRAVGSIADVHFAPTNRARENLLKEGKDPETVFVTGNTGIDTLHMVCKQGGELGVELPPTAVGREILVTLHRRESFGEPINRICGAFLRIVNSHHDVEIMFPVHRNPHVRDPVYQILSNHPRIHLISPLPYLAFVRMMKRAHLVITDSGGIQEEAPALSKPCLVLRDSSERMEAVEAGVARLLGTDGEIIFSSTSELLTNKMAYQAMVKEVSPFGDGRASERIVQILRDTDL